MATLRDLELELGLAEGTLTAKADVAAKWNGMFTTAETQAAEAQRKLAEAQQMNDLINQRVEEFGMTEANVASLQASNAALTAALEAVKKSGFTGITIPDLPPIGGKKDADPMADLTGMISNGFANMAQAFNASNEYQRIFGKPMPDDVSVLAEEARARRMSVGAYAEQKYGFSAAKQKAQEAQRLAEQEKWKTEGAKEWQEKHPVTYGNPELNGGGPSNYPQIPKPRDGAGVRELSSMSARDKIKSTMDRANANAKTLSTAA